MRDTMPIKESLTPTENYARRKFLIKAILAAAVTHPVKVASRETPRAAPEDCLNAKAPMAIVEGKVAFITGGSSGIGLGIARAFNAAGMKIVIGYRTKSHLEEAMRYFKTVPNRVHAIRVDVTDRPSLEQAAAETVRVFGKVHVLVNNAGVVLPPTLSNTSYQDWDWLLNVNLNGPFNGVRAFLPFIQSHGEGGQIITTSSVMGLFAVSSSGAYTASKFAVVGMMEALRAELAETNVGTSVFCPGLVDSNIEESSLQNRPANSTVEDNPELVERMRQLRKDRELSMDPLEAGRWVLRGMRNNDLYIFTHPEYEQALEDRNEALLGSIPRDVSPSEKRMSDVRAGFKRSIYTTERDRRLCAHAKRTKVNER